MSRRILPRILLALAILVPLDARASGSKVLVKFRSITEGNREAKSSGKPILYVFTAEWCGPCHILSREIFADKALADFIEKEYVPVEIMDRTRETGRNSPEIDRLFDKYEVRGFPTLVVTRAAAGSKAIFVAGWPGRETVENFLKTVKKQLAEQEKTGSKKERS